MQTRIVILAAGKGKRMGANVPKPLVEIAGKPMIEHLLENIHESGIDSCPVVVVAPDTHADFHEVCRDKRCEFALQEEQLGTGHAVLCSKDVVGDADAVLVLYGDHPFISAEILARVTKLHEDHHAVVSILTAKLPNFKGDYSVFESWGRIVRDASGKVMGICEAKDATEEQRAITEVNPAIYLFDATWLWEHLPELQNTNANGEYYLTDLVKMAVEEGEDVRTALADPFEVIGVNTPEELARAEQLLGK